MSHHPRQAIYGNEYQLTPAHDDEDEFPYCSTERWTLLSGQYTVNSSVDSIEFLIKEEDSDGWGANGYGVFENYYVDDVQIVKQSNNQ